MIVSEEHVARYPRYVNNVHTWGFMCPVEVFKSEECSRSHAVVTLTCGMSHCPVGIVKIRRNILCACICVGDRTGCLLTYHLSESSLDVSGVIYYDNYTFPYHHKAPSLDSAVPR